METSQAELGLDVNDMYHMSRGQQLELIDQVTDKVLSNQDLGALARLVEQDKSENSSQNKLENSIEKDKIEIGFQFFAKMPQEKLTQYALNPQKAPDKARAFKEALGYDLSNYKELIENIEANIDETKFVEKGNLGHGMRYEYIVELTGPNGKKANVLTAWIEDGNDKRLTSIYITKRKVTE